MTARACTIFVSVGPGVNRVLSSVAAVGTKTATVRLAAGRYQFVCQPHASGMHGAFRVTLER